MSIWENADGKIIVEDDPVNVGQTHAIESDVYPCCPCSPWPASPGSGDFPCGGLAYQYSVDACELVIDWSGYNRARLKAAATVTANTGFWGYSCFWSDDSTTDEWEVSSDGGSTWEPAPYPFDYGWVRIEFVPCVGWTVGVFDIGGVGPFYTGCYPVGTFNANGVSITIS